MALPNQLTEFTSPIIELALKTGARGQTTTTTDYGVIGDAMFKKAQLDLGIAELKTQTGLKQAQIMGDLGMESARINSGVAMHEADTRFNLAIGALDRNIKYQQLKDELRQNDVGFFEGLLNTIGGVASGVAAVATLGGSTALQVAGGVIGGVATAGAQAESGRAGAHGTMNALNTITQGAQIIRGMSDQKKGEDAFKSTMDKLQWLNGVINNPSTPAAQRIEAQQQFDATVGNMANVGLQLGMNPDKALGLAAGTKELITGMGGSGGSAMGREFKGRMGELVARAAADPRFDNPSSWDTAKNDFMAAAQTIYAETHMGSKTGMPPEAIAAYVNQAGFMERKGAPNLGELRPPSESPSASSARRTGTPLPPAQTTNEDLVQPATNKRGIRQGHPAYTAPVEERPGKAWHAPMALGPGVVMDDGAVVPTAPVNQVGVEQENTKAAQDLTKQGGVSLKSLMKTGNIRTAVDSVKKAGSEIVKGAKEQWESGGLGEEEKPRPQQQSAKAPPMEEEKPSYKDKNEKVFKEARDADEVIDHFHLEGRYKDKETAKDMSFFPTATVESNKLKDDIKGVSAAGLTVEQMKTFKHFVEGEGEGAMKASSSGAGGSVLSTGGQFTKSEFTKTLSDRLEKIGERGDLTDKQINAMYKVYTRVNTLSRQIGMAYNKGTLTEQDVEGFRNGLFNMFDPNGRTNLTGVNEIQDTLWQGFKTKYRMMPTRQQSQHDDELKASMQSQVRQSAKKPKHWEEIWSETYRRR